MTHAAPVSSSQDGRSPALCLASGSPPSIAEQLARVAYGRTARVDDVKNANKDWRAGYAVGRYTDDESSKAIEAEWTDRGEPNAASRAFAEWKIGFWAGRFTQIDAKRAASAANAGDVARAGNGLSPKEKNNL